MISNNKRVTGGVNYIISLISKYSEDCSILLPNNFIKRFGGNNLELISKELFDKKIATIHTMPCPDGSIVLSVTKWKLLGLKDPIKKGYKIKYFKNNSRLNIAIDIIDTISSGYKLVEFTPLIYHNRKKMLNSGWIIFYVK